MITYTSIYLTGDAGDAYALFLFDWTWFFFN